MGDAAKRSEALSAPEEEIDERLQNLEAYFLILRPTPQKGPAEPIPGSRWAPIGAQQITLCPRHAQLRKVLEDKGSVVYQFCQVPSNYYAQSLEFRRTCLQASSLGHLCKTIMLESSAGEKVTDDLTTSKYILVIIQYTARLEETLLESYIQSISKPANRGKRIHFRLAALEQFEKLTGYTTGALTPVGCKTASLPIVLADPIAKLQPDFFWMGGGEVDLKMGLRAADFVRIYKPHVADVTAADQQASGAAMGLE